MQNARAFGDSRRGKVLHIALDMCQQQRQANRRASLCVASANPDGAHAMSAGLRAYTASIPRVANRAPLQMHGVTAHDAMVWQQVKLPLNAGVATASAMGMVVASAPGATESSTMVGVAGGPTTVKARGVRAVGERAGFAIDGTMQI